MSCQTYIQLCSDPFDDNEMKIVWAMLYMKTGYANRWTTHEFEHKTKTSHLCFIDWLDFEEECQKDFLLLDAEVPAINTLETSTYFQGKCSVNDYLNTFKDLIEDLEYSGSGTTVVMAKPL